VLLMIEWLVSNFKYACMMHCTRFKSLTRCSDAHITGVLCDDDEVGPLRPVLTGRRC
jgi:hypothetical protein